MSDRVDNILDIIDAGLQSSDELVLTPERRAELDTAWDNHRRIT